MEETGGRTELRVSFTLHHAPPGASGGAPTSGLSSTFELGFFRKTPAAGPILDLHISLCRTPFLVIFSPLESLFNILHIRIKNHSKTRSIE